MKLHENTETTSIEKDELREMLERCANANKHLNSMEANFYICHQNLYVVYSFYHYSTITVFGNDVINFLAPSILAVHSPKLF